MAPTLLHITNQHSRARLRIDVFIRFDKPLRWGKARSALRSRHPDVRFMGLGGDWPAFTVPAHQGFELSASDSLLPSGGCVVVVFRDVLPRTPLRGAERRQGQ